MASKTFVDTSSDVIKQMRKLARKGSRKIAKAIMQETVTLSPNRRGIIRASLKYGARITREGQAESKVGYLSKRKLREKGKWFILNPSWLEFGTKSHSIKAGGNRRDGEVKKGLANKNANILFGKSVVHPGSKPVGALQIASKRIAPNSKNIAAEELKLLNEINDFLMNLPDDGDDEI